MRFLTTVSKGAQHVLLASPETMGQICDNVIMPNLRLRDEDEKLFISNSIGFIGRDSEGSSADTLRWAAFCLLHGILTNYGEQVAPLVSAHIQKMLAAYAADPVNNWKEKDAAIYLVIALMQKPGNSAQVLERVQDQIPKATVLSLLPSVVRFLTHESNVVRSYAAVFIESQLIIMDEVLVNTATRSDCFAAVDPFAPPIIQNLSTALSFCDSYENPYLMKCLMRVLKVANIDDNNVVCAINNRLVAILEDMCNKPKNSEFNNYLFEALTAGIGRLDGPVTPVGFLSVLEKIFLQDISVFVPHLCKLCGQLVSSSKLVEQDHKKMLDILLMNDIWDRPHNVSACLCLLQTLLPKVSIEYDNLRSIIAKFHKLLVRISTEETGFCILFMLIEHVAQDLMKPFIEIIWVVLFGRLEALLQSRWAARFGNSLLVAMSLFIVKHGYNAFESSIGVIEAKGNAFTVFIKLFWIPNLALTKGGRDAKLTAVASIEMLLRSKRKYLSSIDMWGRFLNSTITQLLRSDIPYSGMSEDPLLKDVPEEFFSRSCVEFSAHFCQRFGHIIAAFVQRPLQTSYLLKICGQRNINV
ncbi:hypothetical protein HU200_008730 [Digitaria exilis]|uniref:Uncharacterized protein n=1 Tax=Digitaria exilis TaxID=1010633 RepID=A0A835KRF5_9POAL|nr:hypothetical protein HU200_008730 [Digitaria exilis]